LSTRRPDDETSSGDVPHDPADSGALRARLRDEPGPPPSVPPRPGPAKRRRQRLPRRATRFVPAVLITAGALLCADAIATVVWQEPLTALWASRQQDELSSRLDRIQGGFAIDVPAVRAVGDQAARAREQARQAEAERVALAGAARRLARSKDGEPIGRLTIPRIGKQVVLLQGTKADDLSRGPGHYAGTALPGQTGTFGVAGHRTTYAAPFRHIDQLRRGDQIIARMPYGRFTYRVQRTQIVSPSAVSVLKPVAGQRIVLTACHPLYSAAKRIVVTATLSRVTPVRRAT
jgi:sortase A